mmetsp:Transcript_78480/g.188191  ORF Transcript_78480/g.188191 Transcript_78480/m.188191 type:complete len:251 (-) Transcript_78480:148-900(-)
MLQRVHGHFPLLRCLEERQLQVFVLGLEPVLLLLHVLARLFLRLVLLIEILCVQMGLDQHTLLFLHLYPLVLDRPFREVLLVQVPICRLLQLLLLLCLLVSTLELLVLLLVPEFLDDLRVQVLLNQLFQAILELSAILHDLQLILQFLGLFELFLLPSDVPSHRSLHPSQRAGIFLHLRKAVSQLLEVSKSRPGSSDWRRAQARVASPLRGSGVVAPHRHGHWPRAGLPLGSARRALPLARFRCRFRALR